MGKTISITEFLTEEITIKSRGYAVAGNGGLSMTPTTKGPVMCSVHRLDGTKSVIGDDSLGGKITEEATHAFVCESDPGVVNGDIAVDANGKEYDITFFENVSSFLGGYSAFYGKEIRE